MGVTTLYNSTTFSQNIPISQHIEANDDWFILCTDLLIKYQIAHQLGNQIRG